MKKFINLIKKLFKKEKKQYNSTADITKGFYPEKLFLINLPYAEYVEFEEV